MEAWHWMWIVPLGGLGIVALLAWWLVPRSAPLVHFADLLSEHSLLEIARACERVSAAQRGVPSRLKTATEAAAYEPKRPGCTCVESVGECSAFGEPCDWGAPGSFRRVVVETKHGAIDRGFRFVRPEEAPPQMQYDGGMVRDEDEIDRIRRKNREEA